MTVKKEAHPYRALFCTILKKKLRMYHVHITLLAIKQFELELQLQHQFMFWTLRAASIATLVTRCLPIK